MTDYFSDRQIGSNPRIEETIDKVAWEAILAILDFIEFIARNIGEPTQVGWHGYFSHHHLKLDREAGLEKFVKDINPIFSRNGLAYELSGSGAIERTVSPPMADLVKRTSFRTGDNDLDGLLDTAIDRFLSPEPEARQDAFERLKTIEGGKDKKARAAALIDRAVSDDAPVFRSIVETEFKAMTKAGNELRIRHSEVGHEPVGETGEKDYLFMRLYALVWLMLKRTRRLSEVEREDADREEE